MERWGFWSVIEINPNWKIMQEARIGHRVLQKWNWCEKKKTKKMKMKKVKKKVDCGGGNGCELRKMMILICKGPEDDCCSCSVSQGDP